MRGRVLATVFALASAALCFQELKAFDPPADLPEAMELCDKTDLRPIEGIWTYPEDDVWVLVMRSDHKKGVFDIYVIEAADCSLSPGMKIGEMHTSADPDKFTLRLYTIVKKGILSAPQDATAIYSEAKESLTVKNSSLKVRFNPTRLLPSFWRIASISVKSKEAPPEGMIKIYPSYDGNNSTRRAPRFL